MALPLNSDCKDKGTSHFSKKNLAFFIPQPTLFLPNPSSGFCTFVPHPLRADIKPPWKPRDNKK